MGRKSNKKKIKSVAPQEKQKTSDKQNEIATPNESMPKQRNIWFISAFFFLLAIMLYSNTFQHRFVLDDHGIIANNKMTKAPVSWENTKLMFVTPLRRGDVSDRENSLYRPFTKLVFNIEWNLFSGNPHGFHKVNVIIYGLLCMLLFWVLYDLFKRKWVLPLLITLIFTVHPIHTEVVTNIKSLDEILALLGTLAAMRAIQLYLKDRQVFHLAWGTLAYAVALFSKESAVVSMGMFPLLIYFQLGKFDWRQVLRITSPLLVVAVLFVMTRSAVLSQFPQNAETSVMDNLIVLVKDDYPARFATAVMIVGYYLYTFLVPHPLACDYSYATLEPVTPGHWGFILSFVICLIGFLYAIKKIKHLKLLSFGILWFFITFSLASNVFFLIGTSFGERLLFMPSMGLSMVLVCLLAYFFYKDGGTSLLQKIKMSPLLWGVVLLVSVLYSVKTIARNEDWKNDYALFSRDIEYNPNSTHLLFYMGNHLPSEDRKEVLTDILFEQGFTQQQITDSVNREAQLSITYFNRAMKIYPYLPGDGYNQLGKAYFKIGQLDSSFKYYSLAYKEDSTSGIYTNNVGTVYFNRQQYSEALPYFKKAYRLDSTEADFMNNIGCVYGVAQRADSAIYWFKKAYAADSLDVMSLKFLETTYRAIGDTANADYYKNRMAYVQQQRVEKLRQNR